MLGVIMFLLGARLGLLPTASEEASARPVAINRIATSLPQVGLMVDVAGAQADEIRAAIATLDAVGLSGTWFVDATTQEADKDLVAALLAKGHEIGIKGTDDKPIDRLSQVEVKDRMERARQASVKAGVEPAPFVYPPLGRFSDTVLAVAIQQGYQSVRPAYDASTMRGKESTAAEKLAGSLKRGDLLLVRVGRGGLSPSQAYLTSLVHSLKSRGLALVRLSDMVKAVR